MTPAPPLEEDLMSKRITLAVTIAVLAVATAGAEARAPRMGLEMDPNGVAKRLGPDGAHGPVPEMALKTSPAG